MKPVVAIIGCGWLGFPLAQELVAMGHQVLGTTTRFEKLASLEQAGVRPVRLILEKGKIIGDLQQLFKASVVVIDIPPGRKDPEELEYYPTGIKTLIEQWPGTYLRQILFTSSTSVYGDEQGEVDEQSTPRPDSESGKAVLAAEEVLKSLTVSVNILRLGGLIGGDRHPVKYLAGRSDLANPDSPVNLVHREDVLTIIKTLIQTQAPLSPVNVVAPGHPTRREFYQKIARERELIPPEFGPQKAKNPKLVLPRRLQSMPNFQFRYPDPFNMS